MSQNTNADLELFTTRLIAAAPDLLRATEMLFKLINDGTLAPQSTEALHEMLPAMNQVSIALAKARGEI